MAPAPSPLARGESDLSFASLKGGVGRKWKPRWETPQSRQYPCFASGLACSHFYTGSTWEQATRHVEEGKERTALEWMLPAAALGAPKHTHTPLLTSLFRDRA